ncbi:2-oxo-4-hydroxy-4-carboxy-5-ureidoimidazoline decarboxylase [Paenibacillus abyssi]|uniref:2-oxo-4-hydroxy-4-carboxy-5-ureidoimidazoline decarboxylase n=1 Tax=Paenibacillus abyssi TaxID=1340531 RepID=A0A917FTB8_9BACL|nr:2-oxo-4-hydroxy-4-carboxy-5-ureidoimidazoline decarboxylase [Paenibacillus abyssi]GGF99775.1 hypothetical protein GCM10010916_16280 [Paenibacillus abyssi]
MSISMKHINDMDREQFIQALAGIFEHSPWVADQSWPVGPFASRQALHDAMMRTVRMAPFEKVAELFKAHPDLATRLKVSEMSTAEQQGAGLDRLTQGEYEQFAALNRQYAERFGFPFIMAVKGHSKEEILDAMHRRVRRCSQEEWEQALMEIGRITGFRLLDLIHEDEEEAP